MHAEPMCTSGVSGVTISLRKAFVFEYAAK